MAASVGSINVQWGKEEFVLSFDATTTVGDVKDILCERTRVLPHHQKLMGVAVKGRMAADSTLMSELKLKPNQRVLLMGTPSEEIVEEMDAADVSEVADDFADATSFKTSLHTNPIFLAKIDRRVREVDIEMLSHPRGGRPLAVLDIDHTLYDNRASVEAIEDQARPFLHEFLASLYVHFDIAIWSATSMKWINLKLKGMGILDNPDYRIVFCLDSAAMITVYSEELGVYVCKPLDFIWQKVPQYQKTNTIMLDDCRRNFTMNPGNGLRLRAFKNAHETQSTDKELLRLLEYFMFLKEQPDFSAIDHSKWKKHIKK